MNRRVKHAVFGTLAGAATLVLATWMASPLFAKADKAVNEAPPIAVDVAAETSPSITTTKVVPWCEAHHQPDCDCPECQRVGGFYARALHCLKLWRTMVDEVIVVTDPRAPEPVLSPLVRDLAPLQIIGGAHTNPAIKRRLDNVDGWAQIRDAIEATCRITGTRRFVIDNELGWKSMRLGDYVPDWDRVREGLKLLPADVEYTWYPSISCWVDRSMHKKWCDDDLKLQTEFLKCVVETLPDVRLVTFEHNGPESATYEPEIARQAYVHKHFDVPTFPIVYFAPPSYYWKIDRFIEARDTCNSPAMAVYFGSAETYTLSEIAPRALRQDLERRFAVARDEAAKAVQRARAAEQQVAALRASAAEAEATFSHACDAVHDIFISTTPEPEVTPSDELEDSK
jgi:hypothetical protein